MQDFHDLLNGYTDLATPLLTFDATVHNTDDPFNISLNEVSSDGTDQLSILEQFDFTSVSVSSELVGRDGQAISDSIVTFEFTTSSGQQSSIELPTNAASKVSQAMARGSDLVVTADKTVDATSGSKGGPIRADDALQALRLAVGFDKSDGTSEWHDYIAADINKDGKVGADDALNILKFAVGLTDGPSADWVFVDSSADYSGVGNKSSSYDEGVQLQDLAFDTTVNMTGILVGDVS